MTTTLLPAAADPVGASHPSPRPRRGSGRDLTLIAMVTVVVLLLAVIVGLPLVRILTVAFSREGWEIVSSMLTNPVNRRILWNTVQLGVIVAVLGTGVGFVMAYAQVRLKFRGKKLLHLISLMPIVSPPFAVATAAITLFGRNGIISNGVFGLDINIYGLKGLVFVLTLSFFPVSYMNLKGMLESLDPSLDEAAANLGANKLKIFTSVTLPMLIPGIAGSFLLLFVESIADLANPLVLGGDYTVLASRAYLAVTGEYNVAGGAAYSLVLLLPALSVFLLQRYWVSRKNVVSVTGKPAGSPELITAPALRIPILIVAVFVASLVVLMYATVIFGGFVKIFGVNNDFTLAHYRFVLAGIGSDAMFTTTLLALIATPIAGLLGMLIAWLVVRKLKRTSGLMDFIGMLGLSVPGTVIGIGYAIAFNTPTIFGGRQWFPAVAGGSAILGGSMAIVMVFVARSLPSGQRAGIAALQQINPAIDEAATSLGADSLTTFRTVTLPLIRPALLSGLTYAFARSMTTLSPIVFITTPQTKIMTSQILAEVDAGRFGNAFAYCAILIVIVLSFIGLLNLAMLLPSIRGIQRR
ncbi:iron(III)-transport system permease protein sfuB [Janibacter sp. HTCC2649]|uniref:ABC transporter permease n=1 Tax=Janibacter sp. HTCC2649 TaxID=313589 RepID=UPI000066ED10|nr:iron ABC transporter permease [Janibacter sp. HTCC2649]EAP99231.1 iron(III)-transport system permease protein sfuB [Janibacter sp. HTCC2649]